VREESHLDDMRAAIRGDFERLEERRGEQELMRIAEAEPESEPEPEPPEPEAAPVPRDVPDVAPATEPEPRGEAAQPEPEPRGEVAHPEPEPEPRAHRNWLDRLLGR